MLRVFSSRDTSAGTHRQQHRQITSAKPSRIFVLPYGELWSQGSPKNTKMRHTLASGFYKATVALTNKGNVFPTFGFQGTSCLSFLAHQTKNLRNHHDINAILSQMHVIALKIATLVGKNGPTKTTRILVRTWTYHEHPVSCLSLTSELSKSAIPFKKLPSKNWHSKAFLHGALKATQNRLWNGPGICLVRNRQTP